MTLSVEVTVQVAIALLPPELASITEAQWQQWLSCWLAQTQPIFALPPATTYGLTLRLGNDAQIQQLNQQYRQQDRATDVLAFATLDNGAVAAAIASEPLPEWELGDIIISLDTARAQAQGHTLRQEVVWLVSHGFLHLLGWDHPNAEQLEQMLQQQEHLLKQIQIPPPTR
ncbi:MAG: rRNA maturation RNase YbeY [Cyanobacteria bacterium P01_G01_bin.54]